ncbi:hypothetical protein MTF65_11270 [Streptomyces sp. APSN-46.1]|uniref:hypothetical protein n=1 Tax=Streptomyces sp. APSN-46.1 TaxID=2929049 RepID=UPI001FB33CA4|nr:hypothetical protein [Streptomyces sp. APSN-46.1]MCJ1677912.1 hypothetical protein [Streptomyces sp. APSN-46.1]
MVPQIVAVAGAAGTAIVSAMATDGWQRARDGVVELWQRFRPESADSIHEDFEENRRVLVDSLQAGEEHTHAALVAAWNGYLLGLLVAQPQALDALRQLNAVLAQENTGGAHPSLNMTAHASGNGQVFQAGRDQRITQS